MNALTARSTPRRGSSGPIAAAVGVLIAAVVSAATHAQPGPAALPPSVVLEVPIAGLAGVPADAAGVVVNVTSTRSGGAGFAVAYPCTDVPPPTSNLNFAAGIDAAAAVLAPLSPAGSICLAVSAVTDVVVDVFGYLPAGSPIEPLWPSRRAVDTRNGIGVATAGPVPAGTPLEVDTGAVPGLGDVDGVAIGVVGVGPTAPGFVSVGPCGGSTPTTSTVNLIPGRDVANLALTAVPDDDTVCLIPSVTTHLVVDVMGKVAAGAVDPELLPEGERVIDSRLGIGTSATPWGPGETRTVSIAGVASGGGTAFVNLTATRATAAGFAVLHPCDDTPTGSNLNFVPGVDVANAAIVRVADDWTFCLTSSARTDLLVDLVAVSTDPDTIVSFDAVRVYDSRAEEREACGLAVAHPAPDTLWVVDLAARSLVAAITSDEFDPFVLGNSSSLPARITPECDALIVATNRGTQADPGRVGVLRAAFGGGVTAVDEFTVPNPPVFDFDLLADGSPVWWDGEGIIRRVSDGTTVIDCGGSCGSLVDLLEDDVAAEAVPFDWRLYRPGDAVWFDIVLRHGELSPARTYQLVVDESTFRVVVADAERVHTVVERDFAALAGPGPTAWSGFWVDDGLVAICLDPLTAGEPTRTFVWNIFGDPKELPVAACLTSGR